MTAHPTGRLVGDDFQLIRIIDAPLAEVWAAISESDRLDSWIGRYEGDPASGQVDFFMTAEGDGPAVTVVIDACEPPRLVAVTQETVEGAWRLRAELAEQDTATELTFTHIAVDAQAREMVGPGWEYYLDRLVAAVTGGDVASIDWDRDYYPVMVEHYRSLG